MPPLPPGRQLRLMPGDVAFGEQGDSLETLLGSCVAIVLTDPRRTMGAMCHIVHTGLSGDAQPTCAWGEVALEAMAAGLRERGLSLSQCEAYLYGGGNMFPTLDIPLSVGEDNAHWAIETMERLGIRVLHMDLGGEVYRRLQWTVGPTLPQVTTVAL